MTASLTTVILAGTVAALWVGVLIAAAWHRDLTRCPDCGHRAGTLPAVTSRCANTAFHPPP